MGLVTCDGSEPWVTRGWLANARFGLTAGAVGASLRFTPREGGAPFDATLMHRMTTAFVEWRPTRRWSLGGGAGALLGGRLSLDRPTSGLARALAPGPVATLSSSYLLATEGSTAPFLLLGLSLGAGFERLVEERGLPSERFTSVDLRASLTFGKTFANRLRPYASLRAFGGPVFLGDRAVGSDRYHLQGALGLAVVMPRGFDVFAEASPGPERSATFGVGFAPGR